MQFVRRDAILLGGSIMLAAAAAAYLPLAAAIAIGAGIFFGFKLLASSRAASIAKRTGEGICAECGAKISAGRCPACDAGHD